MTVTSPLLTLLKSNFRSWVSAKGFWLVVASALLPLVLTGAWVGAHRADVAVTGLQYDSASLQEGNAVRFTATLQNTGPVALDAFNATLAIGEVEAGRLFPLDSETILVEGLGPGETREIALEWNATPGVLFVLATADVEDALGERDEYNNQQAEPIAVKRAAPDASTAPAAPRGLAGDANSTVEADLAVTLVRGEGAVAPGDARTLRMEVTNRGEAPVENATAVVRVSRPFAGRNDVVADQRENVTLGAGETKTLEVAWTAQEGVYWHEGWVQAPASVRDPAPENNHLAEPILVDAAVPADFQPPDIPEKLTIKEFYLDVLSLLHLRILLPFVALFYAAGVIADERERGSLAYLLTRPIPRWLIPITKFVASFAVASVAILLGLLATYLFLFGTTSQAGDIGFLSTPVLASILTLFVYGALFTLIGTIAQRPYIVGVAIVLGWENAANLLVPWVRELTLTEHIGRTLVGDAANVDDGWLFDQGLQWLPAGDVAMRALLLLLAVGAAFLVAASVNMRRREFEV